MGFSAEKLTAFLRVVLTVAFICSSLSYSMPIAEASIDVKIAAIASLEHDHCASSELDSSITKPSALDSDDEECVPDGKSHNGHGKSPSDCCATICFDLTILSSQGRREAKLPPVHSAEFPQSVLAVGPYRFLRPPRA